MSTAEDPSIVPKPERVRHYGPRWTPLPAGRGTLGSRVILVGVDGVPVSVVSRLGHPSYCLPSIADEIQADVVVVGASSQMHSGLGGSLATRLIRLSRWPVTVVP